MNNKTIFLDFYLQKIDILLSFLKDCFLENSLLLIEAATKASLEIVKNYYFDNDISIALIPNILNSSQKMQTFDLFYMCATFFKFLNSTDPYFDIFYNLLINNLLNDQGQKFLFLFCFHENIFILIKVI